MRLGLPPPPSPRAGRPRGGGVFSPPQVGGRLGFPHLGWPAGPRGGCAPGPVGPGRTPLVHVALPGQWAHRWPLRNLLETLRYNTGEFPNFFETLKINFPYMNLILRTIPNLLVMSWIPSETPNKLRSSPLLISHFYPSDVER